MHTHTADPEQLVLAHLAAIGTPARYVNTGGGCMVIELKTSETGVIWVTDDTYDLDEPMHSWRWIVGYYPNAYTYDGQSEADLYLYPSGSPQKIAALAADLAATYTEA